MREKIEHHDGDRDDCFPGRQLYAIASFGLTFSTSSSMWVGWMCGVALLTCIQLCGDGPVSIATFNVENYLLESIQGRRVKSSASRQAVWNALQEMQADVVFLQELGSLKALESIRTNVFDRGLSYPYVEFSESPGSPIHLGLLSRLPVMATRHHATNVFVLYGRAFRPSRAFFEVDFQLSSQRSLKVFAAHFKSKRPVPYADQWDLRTREAKMLRELIDDRMKRQPDQLLAVVGDLNDDPASQTYKYLIGAAGKWRLMDTRPSEGRPGMLPISDVSPGSRHAVWTHFFDDEDLFSRVDYVLMNRRLAQFYRRDLSYVLERPDWGIASDHRPVVATFMFP